MWSVIVVVDAPSLEHGAGMWQGPKQRFVEQFVPEPADERFGEGILRWLAWRNVLPGDLMIVGPAQDGIASQLCAVVTHDHLWLAALDEQAVELARHSVAGDRRIRDQRQALAGAVIDHNQNAQPPPVNELIGDKVDRPAVIRQLRNRHRRARPKCTFAAAAPANHKAFLTIKPE